MRQGDIVRVALGKPRPAVVVQSDELATPVEVLVCPFTTTSVDAPFYRVPVDPTADNGLKEPSQLMADKVGPAPRDKIDGVIGRLADDDLERLKTALMLILDLAD